MARSTISDEGSAADLKWQTFARFKRRVRAVGGVSDYEEASPHFETAIAIDAIAFGIDVMVAASHIDEGVVSARVDVGRFPTIINGIDSSDATACGDLLSGETSIRG